MFIKDLTPGQQFTYNGKPTVYRAQRVMTGTRMTTVVYTIDDTKVRNEIYTHSLASVTVL